MEDFTTMPGHLMRRAHQISTSLFTEECGGFDLTSVQFAALSAIAANPDSDATRLSALIAFDRSTLGDVLERMERKGWIVRVASPSDRRVKVVRLSPIGTRLLRKVAPAVQRVQERLLEPLSAVDRRSILRLLKLLAEGHDDPTPRTMRIAGPG